jgi:hypothetical protein
MFDKRMKVTSFFGRVLDIHPEVLSISRECHEIKQSKFQPNSHNKYRNIMILKIGRKYV